MSDEVSIDIQRQILQQERQVYVNTRFMWQAKMKAVKNLIEKKILNDGDEAPILTELTKIEAWIAEYDEQLAELKQSPSADKVTEHSNGKVEKEHI